MSLRVYALVPARARLTHRGLRLVTHGSVAAVVAGGRVRAANRRNLLAYDRTLRRLAECVGALLPVRFNTLLNDEAELVAILRANRVTFARALAHVDRRVQMTVRVSAHAGSASLAAVEPGRDPRPAPGGGRVGPGVGGQYLRARAAARRLPQLDPVRRSVRKWVRDERTEVQAGLVTMYHLIPRGTVDAYRQAIHAAAAGANMRLIVSGPFPPYAFAEGA